MAKFEHGTMNTSTQENTYDRFVKYVVRGVVIIALFLVFLAIVGG